MDKVIDYQIAKDFFLGDIYFPIFDKVIAPVINQNGIWEPNEVNWLKNNISPGDICVNVGANVGYFTMLMSVLTGNNGKVYSFEPNPELKPFIDKNIGSLSNVEFYPIAIGDNQGNTEIHVNSINCGDNRVFNPLTTKVGANDINNKFDGKKYFVKIDKLDSIINDKINILLCDTQGWDYKVLMGFKQSIIKHKPKILMEFTPGWVRDNGDDPITAFTNIMSWGYNIKYNDFIVKNIEDLKIIIDQEINNTWNNIELIPIKE